MNLKISPFSIQEKNASELDTGKEYPTIDDLMREQNTQKKETNTVHHRRDLDTLD